MMADYDDGSRKSRGTVVENLVRTADENADIVILERSAAARRRERLGEDVRRLGADCTTA
jgi:hypothetical protein